MQGIARWIGSNFAAAELIAVAAVVAGVFMAMKSRDSAIYGWILAAAGLFVAVWALKLKGLW